jgi:antitoxin component HigA of HigAB toxin-antitoxin module
MAGKEVESLAQRLAKCMNARGIGVPELARKSELTRSCIYDIQHGEEGIRLETAKRLAKGLNIPLALLIDPTTVKRILDVDRKTTLAAVGALAERLGVPISLLVG